MIQSLAAFEHESEINNFSGETTMLLVALALAIFILVFLAYAIFSASGRADEQADALLDKIRREKGKDEHDSNYGA